jgi:alpha-D-xyloside xylohydrolase
MRLFPYSYSLAAMTTFRGYTPMRGLAMDFPNDAASYGIGDQFLYGPALMACPVTEPMVHLPKETLIPLGTDDIVTSQGKGKRLRVFDGLDSTQATEEHVNRAFFDHNWSGNLPAGARTPAYRIEFSGRLQTPRKGAVLLIRVAGRVRVDLAGQCVVDDWRDAPLREHRVPVDSDRHRNAELQVTYGHQSGDAVIQVGWEINAEWKERGAPAKLERTVHLPDAAWYDFWTGRRFEGGRTVAMPAPLERMPVLVRAGSILPMGPHKQWHDEVPDDPIELRVYPGADGRFTLYEDAGDSYAYERGEFSEMDLEWNDAASTLTLGARRGGFAGMLANRTFHVVRVRQDHGAGIEPETHPDRVIRYTGSRILTPEF